MSISDLCTNYVKKLGDKTQEKNILDFVESPWGLGLGSTPGIPPLHPAQRIILKTYYGLELNKGSERNVRVMDNFNEVEKYRFNENEYINYLYNEGRCNVSDISYEYPNLLLVAGRRGGKCITGDSLVLTEKGVYHLGDLGIAPEEGFSPLEIEISQGKDQRSKTAAFYNGGIKKTVEIITKSGYKIVGTENHRVKTENSSKKPVWKYLSDVVEGDKILLARGTDFWSKNRVNVIEKFDVKKKHLYKINAFLGEGLAYMLGRFLGKPIKNFSVFNAIARYPMTYDSVKEIHGGCFFDFFKNIGIDLDTKIEDYTIPWSILRSPKKEVCSFLQGVFNEEAIIGDGGIQLSIKSKVLLQELQVLLLNLGILSESSNGLLWIKEKKSLKIFCKYISFKDNKKFKILCNLISDVNTNILRETYDDVVSIEEREDQVYDLNVPEGSCFVANGMINHNTTVTSSIIAYEIYKLLCKHSPQEYYSLQPNSQIKLTCVSTSKQTASELFNMVIGSIEQCQWFNRYRQEPTKEVLALQTERDIELHGHSKHARASLLLRVSACSAKGLRGPSNMVIGLDEMAHFFEDEKANGSTSGSDKNDRAIYNAITPSVANFTHPNGEPAGKIVCLSSPATKSGKFFEEYERSFHENVDDLLMLQIPTWEMNPAVPSKFLKQRYTENSIVYNVEYGAIFDDRMKGWIEDPEIVRQCIVPGMKYKQRSNQRIPHFMGVDVGLKEDGTSICVCHHVEERVGGAVEQFIEVDASDIRFAIEEGKKHFVPKDISDWIKELNDRFFIVKGLMDQYYGMGIIPLLEQDGLKQFEYRIFSEQLNSTIYQNLLTHFISNSLRLPEGEKIQIGDRVETDSELVQEILTLQAYQKSKYVIKVEAPDREGCHDDRSDALARAVLLATEYKSKGYGSMASIGASAGAKAFRMSLAKERFKRSINRPSKGLMSSREAFSRSIRSGMRYR